MSETSAPEPAVTTAAHTPPIKRRGWKPFAAALAAIVLIALIWWIVDSWSSVSTDDAYVNGHVTFVAARVGSQVARVLVDDNNRVHKGDLLVELDKAPYQVQVDIAQAAISAAQSDLTAAQASTRALTGQTRSARFNLERAIQDVDNQVALLRSKVASVASQRATLEKAQADYERAQKLIGSGAVAQEDFEQRKELYLVAQAKLEEALQGVYQVRVALGLPPKPENGDDLTSVPPDLDQTFSTVKEAQSTLMQYASQLGVNDSYNKTPKDMVADFYKRDPSGDIDKIYAQLLKDAPAVKQAEAKLLQAQRVLDQALLNLQYTNVFSEIDGVVTRRNVNPGNNVVAGQSLMAVRSLKEIWVDANFKETQLGGLRIGQPADLDVDMYGSRMRFKGRISGFTFGTGSTLALLPAENATGNFVKVVQRLPVRIELTDYDPDKAPLFIGLSVTATVYTNETPTGPNAGKVLQPEMPTSQPATQP